MGATQQDLAHHGHAGHAGHDGHGGHDDHHEEDPLADYHATVKGYVVGFILSAVLTIIPFWLVMAKVLPKEWTVPIILALGAVQLVVQMVYFLHMNSKVESGWSMVSLVFTVVFVAIIMAGSVWVMYNMNLHMMPTHDMNSMI